MVKLKLLLWKITRRLSAWAWKNEIEYRYTALEVAEWLFYYRGKEREIDMTTWIRMYREHIELHGRDVPFNP